MSGDQASTDEAAPAQPIQSLSRFVERVSKIRERWRVEDHKELWFRGEGEEYKNSFLRPALYRPPKDAAMKEPRDLLDIESELYDEFRRCGAQLLFEKVQVEDRDWDWYKNRLKIRGRLGEL
jgi:hypothetical protein